MADREPVSLDALNGLLKERQRYEEWLTALEQKRGATSEAVYERVQADYRARLREVSSKLAERAGELRESIDALTSRFEDIARQELQQREARQEAELRAAVGEYTDKQWKEIGGAWDKELTRLVKEKNAIDSQLTELNRIFALSVKERQAEAIAMGRMPSEDGARGSAATPISPVVARPAVPEPPTLIPPSRIEQPAGARQQTQAPTPGRTPFDEFPVLRPGSGGVSPPSTTAVATPPSVPKSGGANDPRSEQHKTLKCPECGAANYPTEWYCERCGGELATM
jgi:TolA-binding protein